MNEITGYTVAEINRLGWYQTMYPDPAMQFRARDRMERMQRGDDIRAEESRITRIDGSERILNISTSLVESDDGLTHVLALMIDITEKKAAHEALKAALREKEVLLREIHHRVKNNMQVISSLLSLQAERARNQEERQILLESQRRIHSMSMIHQAFYGGRNLSTVDFSTYLESLVYYLEEAYKTEANVHMILEMEPLELGIDQAVPCGLILNELIANAFKHAFPDGRSGTIRIRGYRVDDGEVALEVGDDGAGFPAGLDIENVSSLGLRLVKGLLVYQLKGRLQVAREDGVRFILRWPLPDGKGEKE
jgi:PAS domain S-box-containing protein